MSYDDNINNNNNLLLNDRLRRPDIIIWLLWFVSVGFKNVNALLAGNIRRGVVDSAGRISDLSKIYHPLRVWGGTITPFMYTHGVYIIIILYVTHTILHIPQVHNIKLYLYTFGWLSWLTCIAVAGERYQSTTTVIHTIY